MNEGESITEGWRKYLDSCDGDERIARHEYFFAEMEANPELVAAFVAEMKEKT